MNSKNTQSIFNWVQVVTGIAVLLGLGLVVWELQQTKRLSYGQILTDEFTRFYDRSLTLMGEDPRSALAKASFCPERLTVEDTVTLHAFYATVTLNWSAIRLTADVSGIERLEWEPTVRGQTLNFLSSKPGSKWLRYWANSSEFVNSDVASVALETLANDPPDYLGGAYRSMLTGKQAITDLCKAPDDT